MCYPKRLSRSAGIFLPALPAMLAVLAGCATLETRLPPQASGWTAIPLEKKARWWIFGEKYVLEKYSLIYRGDNAQTGTRGYTETSGTVRKYDFYRDDGRPSRVVLTTSERTLTFGGGGRFGVTLEQKKTIRLPVDERVTTDYTISEAKGEAQYVTFRDAALGEVAFARYRDDAGAFTGFTLTVGGEDWGLLAFRPAALYLRDRAREAQLDNIACYVLAAYVSYLFQASH